MKNRGYCHTHTDIQTISQTMKGLRTSVVKPVKVKNPDSYFNSSPAKRYNRIQTAFKQGASTPRGA